MADSLILMVMALVVFGPRRLPQIGRQIGKLMYEFRKASNDFKFQMEEELRSVEEADRRKKEEERMRAMALAPPVPAPAELPAEVPAQVIGAQFPMPGAKSPYPGEALYPVQHRPLLKLSRKRYLQRPTALNGRTGKRNAAQPHGSSGAGFGRDRSGDCSGCEPSGSSAADPPAKPKRKRTRTKPAPEHPPLKRSL